MNREALEKRIEEIDSVINQQAQHAQQMNNQILMLHGAKEEVNAWIKKLIQDEIESSKQQEESPDGISETSQDAA